MLDALSNRAIPFTHNLMIVGKNHLSIDADNGRVFPPAGRAAFMGDRNLATDLTRQ
jgi:hypothetical protein